MAYGTEAFAAGTAEITAGSPTAVLDLGVDPSLAFNANTVEFAAVGGQNAGLVAAAMAAIENTASFAVEAAQEVGYAAAIMAERAVDTGIGLG